MNWGEVIESKSLSEVVKNDTIYPEKFLELTSFAYNYINVSTYI